MESSLPDSFLAAQFNRSAFFTRFVNEQAVKTETVFFRVVKVGLIKQDLSVVVAVPAIGFDGALDFDGLA